MGELTNILWTWEKLPAEYRTMDYPEILDIYFQEPKETKKREILFYLLIKVDGKKLSLSIIAYNIIRDLDLAQDFFHELREHVFNQLEKVERPGNFEAWMRKVTRNLAINFSKKRINREYSESTEIKEKHFRAQSNREVVVKQIKEAAGDLLKEMETSVSPKAWKAIKLKCSGASHVEVAREMGLSITEFRGLYGYNRKKLKKLFGEKYKKLFP